MGNADSSTCKAVGLPHGWHAIAHMAHVNADGYCSQVAYPYTAADTLPRYRYCRNGTWTPWTHFDGGTLPVFQPSAAELSGMWMPGQYMAGWGLVVQIPSCYPINMTITGGEVYAAGWKTLPAPSVPRSYQTYYVVFNARALGLTDGASYIVRFNATLN